MINPNTIPIPDAIVPNTARPTKNRSIKKTRNVSIITAIPLINQINHMKNIILFIVSDSIFSCKVIKVKQATMLPLPLPLMYMVMLPIRCGKIQLIGCKHTSILLVIKSGSGTEVVQTVFFGIRKTL